MKKHITPRLELKQNKTDTIYWDKALLSSFASLAATEEEEEFICLDTEDE